MATVQTLKKQLRGIRSTQKLTKAMKTISTVKFSKLNGLYGKYAPYGAACLRMHRRFGRGFVGALPAAKKEAPRCVVVLASNKGLCGSFNAEVLSFARKQMAEGDVVIPCGKKAIRYFRARPCSIIKEVVPSDVPTYEEAASLLKELVQLRKEGEISGITVIYSHYVHMMQQQPDRYDLFAVSEEEEEVPLCCPDRETVEEAVAMPVFCGMFYRLMLEAALGAQAATLMTMRSANDTATEYVAHLEEQINRKRQSAVTADVLETATEWGEE